jgi:hypothetical protein
VRNIEAVAALSPQAQTRLLEAVQAGLKRLPRAIEQLRADPQTSVAELLDPPTQPETGLPAQNDSASIGQDVADLIQECFPYMPRVSAEALADADVMQIVRSVAETHQQVFKSSHIKTDFVMLTLHGLMCKTLEQLEEIIEKPTNGEKKKHVETYCFNRREPGGAGCVGWNLSGGVHRFERSGCGAEAAHDFRTVRHTRLEYWRCHHRQ